MHRLLFSLASSGRAGRRLTVFIYHRVLERKDWMRPSEPDAATFRWQMGLISNTFRVLPLSEAVTALRAGTLPSRVAAITFDDGYRDNVTVALPVLRSFGLTATFFIASGYLGQGVMWNDAVLECFRHAPAGDLDLSDLGLGVVSISDNDSRRTAALAVIKKLRPRPGAERERVAQALAARMGSSSPRLMMSHDQVRDLADARMEIGAHTVTHPTLAAVGLDEARCEIADGRAELQALSGQAVSMFAYPVGRPGIDYRPEHVAMVKQLGFTGAVSTHWGVSDRRTDPWQLPRFTPWDRTTPRFLLRLARNLRQVPCP